MVYKSVIQVILYIYIDNYISLMSHYRWDSGLFLRIYSVFFCSCIYELKPFTILVLKVCFKYTLGLACIEPLIHQSKLRTYTTRTVSDFTESYACNLVGVALTRYMPPPLL